MYRSILSVLAAAPALAGAPTLAGVPALAAALAGTPALAGAPALAPRPNHASSMWTGPPNFWHSPLDPMDADGMQTVRGPRFLHRCAARPPGTSPGL